MLIVRRSESLTHSSVSEEPFFFIEMTLPNGINVTMEIKHYILVLIKHLPSLFLSWVNGLNSVLSSSFNRLRSRRD